MRWMFRNAYEAFHEYREQWDTGNRSCSSHILLDSRFVEPLVRHFGRHGVLLGIATEVRNRNVGMVLVRRRGIGFWETFQPGQAPLGLIVLDRRKDQAELVRELMSDLPGATLGFSVLQQDPDFSAFQGTSGRHIETLEYIDTPRLVLTDSFEAYWQAQKKDLDTTHNLSKRSRRLARQGIQMTLGIDRDPQRVAESIEQHGRLEQSGWKGRVGTAIAADNEQGAFYREVLENFCQQNEGVMYRLFFNDEIVASQLALERDGMLVFLKTAYDEKFKEFSPGFLLQLEILKMLYSENRIKMIEFYGRVRDWHSKWRAETRKMYHINFYRHEWVLGTRRILKARLSR